MNRDETVEIYPKNWIPMLKSYNLCTLQWICLVLREEKLKETAPLTTLPVEWRTALDHTALCSCSHPKKYVSILVLTPQKFVEDNEK